VTDKNTAEEDGDSFDNDETPDDFDDIENKPVSLKDSAVARRRLEQVMEERALERLLKEDYDDWD